MMEFNENLVDASFGFTGPGQSPRVGIFSGWYKRATEKTFNQEIGDVIMIAKAFLGTQKSSEFMVNLRVWSHQQPLLVTLSSGQAYLLNEGKRTNQLQQPEGLAA